MAEINLMESYPNPNRDIEWRAKNITLQQRVVSSRFDREYFDGDRLYGYGGYTYDGRWIKIVERFNDYYKLNDKSSILDIGCGKGFMLHDFMKLIPGIKVSGIDISTYAIDNAMEEIKPFLQVANANNLPFPDKSFDLVISINSIHSLPFEECKTAIREIERVSRKHAFITVDAWHDDFEKERLSKWVIVIGGTVLHVDDWKELFKDAGYAGDYYWWVP